MYMCKRLATYLLNYTKYRSIPRKQLELYKNTHDVIRIYVYIHLPSASPPPCPEQIPKDPFWVPWAPAGFPFRYPWAPPWALFGGLGNLLVSLLVLGRKKRRKVTWRTLALGSKLGLKIVTFPEKSGNKHEKMGSQTGSGKRVLS